MLCVRGASVVFLFLYPLIVPAGGFGFVSQARPFGRMHFSNHSLKLAAGALVVCVFRIHSNQLNISLLKSCAFV